MSLKIAIVCEASTDYAIASGLADRKLVDQIDWLGDDILDSQRTWVSSVAYGKTNANLTWQSIAGLAKDAGIRVHGLFNGQPGQPDARAARRAIALLRHLVQPLHAIVLIRDTDKQLERKQGLQQAREHYSQLTTVLGVAVPEIEAWMICGFEPGDNDEQKTLQTERSALGFDPRLRSEELMATNDNSAKRSAKRVLQALTLGDTERKLRFLQETPMATLRERGGGNGLADYLAEIGSRLAPSISGDSGP